MRAISDAERRARLGALHFPRGDSEGVAGVADSLLGLHSSDPATVYLTVRARMAGFETGDLERALYDDRSLVRILGMRRTMWVVSSDIAPQIHYSSTEALVAAQQRRTWKLVEDAGLTRHGRKWVTRACDATIEALGELGPSTALELRRRVPQLREQLTVFKRDGGIAGMTGASTRILFLLATEGRVVRGRPRGTWLSSQYEWALYEQWLGSPRETTEPFLAQQVVLERWLERFGPATELDAKWWTGWPVTLVRKAIDSIGAVPVETSEGAAYLAPGDVDPPQPDPWVAFLPGLDPSVMGWKQRDWYLGGHAAEVFDRNGNAGPTVMVDGQVAGVWAQLPDGRIVNHLFAGLGSARRREVDEHATALEAWLSGYVVTPRFRTPLERRLAEGGA